jgi:hypothetical protein
MPQEYNEFSFKDLPQDITFRVGNVGEFIKLCANGDIYVRGKLIENDKELVDGMREWLTRAREGLNANDY